MRGCLNENGKWYEKGWKRMMAEKKIVKWILFLAMLVSVCGAVYIILAYSKYYFHSDCAPYLFLAKEQLAQKKMFPDRFHYTTDIFFLTPSVTMVPFLAFLNNELFAHELGILLYIIIICALICKVFWHNKKAAAIVVALFLLPLSWVVTDMFFSQGAYLTMILFKVLLLLAIQFLFVTEDHISAELVRGRKKRIAAYMVYLFIGLLVNYAMLRGIATDMLPIFFSFISMIIIREGISLKGIMRQKELLLYGISTVAIIVVSYIHYVMLCGRLGFDAPALSAGSIVDSTAFCENILNFPSLVLGLLGWESSDRLFGIVTFKTCMIFVYVVISQIVIPLFLLLKVRRISDRFMQFIVLYVNCSNFLSVFVMVSIGAMESRYYLPVYFNNLLLVGLMGKWLLDNNYKVLKAVPAVAVFLLTACIYGKYFFHDVPDEWKQNISLFNPEADQTFYQFLLENDLTYGFATFWNAHTITVLSNEKVVAVSYYDGKPTMPLCHDATDNYVYWGASEDYYNPNLHAGRCFVLVGEGEIIPEAYYQLAEETLTYGKFTILVYEKNISEYPELVAAQ